MIANTRYLRYFQIKMNQKNTYKKRLKQTLQEDAMFRFMVWLKKKNLKGGTKKR